MSNSWTMRSNFGVIHWPVTYILWAVSILWLLHGNLYCLFNYVVETEHLFLCVYVYACKLKHLLSSGGRRELAGFSSVLSKINKRAKRNGAHEIKASDRKQ